MKRHISCPTRIETRGSTPGQQPLLRVNASGFAPRDDSDHAGPYHSARAFRDYGLVNVSMPVFKPEWKAFIEAGTRSMLRLRFLVFGLVVIGVFASVILSGR
jgi:hypothetical protein